MKCTEKISYEDFSRLMIINEGLGATNEDGVPIVGIYSVPEENENIDDGTLFLSQYNNEDLYNEVMPTLISLSNALNESHTAKLYCTEFEKKKKDEDINWLLITGVTLGALGIYLYYKKIK